MRTSLWVAAAGVIATVAIAAPSALADDGQKFKTKLSGANEVNATGARDQGDPDGVGQASIKIDDTTVCYKLKALKIGTAAAAHIHSAPAGVNGPVVVALAAPNSRSEGCVTVATSLAAALVATPELYYVNVHTAAFRGGAIRGQLSA